MAKQTKINDGVLAAISIEDLRALLARKEQEALQPSIDSYYALKKEYKVKLDAARKAILAINPQWEPLTISDSIVKILANAGKQLSKAEIQTEYGDESNIGLPLSQLEKTGKVIEREGKYSLQTVRL